MDGWQLPQDYDRLKRQRQDKDMKRASLQETLDRGSSSSKERERGRGGSLFHSQRETSQAKSLKEPIELFSSDLSRDRLARSKVTPAERTIQDQHMMSEDMHDRMDTTSTSTSMPFPAPDFTQDQDTPQPHHRSSQDLLHQIESLRAENSRLHQQHSEQPTTPSRAFFSHYTSHVARTPDRSIGRSRSFSISSPESFARTTSEPDERIIELQNEVDHLRQSRSSQFMELEAMKNKIQKLTSEVMASNNARAAMENSKNAEIETLKSMVVDLEMDVAALQEELEVSHSRMEELEVARVDVQRLQEEKQMLEHEVVTLETERKEVDDLRSQVAEQRARLESRESNTVILKRYNNLEEDYHQLQNDLAVKREELENLRSSHRAQASEIARLQADKNVVMGDDNENASQQLEEAQQKLAEALARVSELEARQSGGSEKLHASHGSLISVSSSRVLSRQASSAGSFVDVHDEMKELRQDLDMKSALADLQGQRIRSLEELDQRRSAGSEGQSDPRASGRLPKSDDLRLEDLHPPMPTSSSATSTTLSASEPIPGTTAFSRSSSSRPTTAYDEAKVEAMLVAIERLRMERNELRNEVHFLRLEKRFDDPTREQELLSQLEATKARQEKAEEELAHANAMCEEVQSVVSGKESELGSLRSELARTTEELSRAQCLVEELEKTIDEHDGVQSELCSIQAELEASREQLHEAQVERDRLKSRVEALESDCQRLTQDLDRAESRSRELETLVSSTSESTEMEELKQRILRRTEQIGIHQHEIRRLETNLKLTEESLHEITAELKKFEVERDLSRMETAKEKEESDRAKKRLAELEDEQQTILTELQEKRSLLEEKDRLSLQSEEMRTGEMATVVALLAEVTCQSRASSSSWKKERGQLAEELSGVRKDLDATTSSKTSLQEKLDAVQTDLSRLQFENTMLDDVAKKAEESRQAANLLSEENDALKNSVAELEAVVEEERSSMAEIRRSLEDLESQYHDLESSSVEKLERIMTLESELKQTEELQAETAQKLSKALHSAKDLSEVRAQLKERDFSIEELMSGKQALESTCKDLKLRNTDLLDQISALERELQEAAESTTELEMNRELVEKMQNDLDSKDLELSEFKTKLQRQEIEADRVQKAHETLMKSLDKVSETLGTQIKDLQAKLDSAEDDVAAKTSEIELANSKIEANEQKLVLLQKEIQELQGELQTQRAESEKLLRQKVDECEAYDDRLIEADMEKKRLRAKNDALQRKLDKFMQQNTTDSDPHSAPSNPSSKDLEPSRPTERAVEKRPSLNDARSEGAEVKEPSLDSISQPLGARRPLASATNLSSRPQAQQPSSTASEKPRPLGGLRLPPSLGAAREANRPILRSIRVRSHNPSILPTSGATESVDPAPQAPPILSLPSLHSSESTNSKKRPRDEADDPQRTDPEAIMVSGRSQPLRGMRRMLGPERSSGFTPVRSGQRQDTGSSQLGKQDPKLSLPFRPLDIRPPESRPTARVPFPSFKPKSPGDT